MSFLMRSLEEAADTEPAAKGFKAFQLNQSVGVLDFHPLKNRDQ